MLQSLIDQWERMGDMGMDERHNATQTKSDVWSEWADEWVFRILLAPHRVRASYQEEEALRNFERAQREGAR